MLPVPQTRIGEIEPFTRRDVRPETRRSFARKDDRLASGG